MPKTIGEVYQKAKAYVIIATTTKSNGTPVSFATTAESFLKSNKKKTPRGSKNNRTNSPANKPNDTGLHVQNGPTITPPTTNGATVESSTASTASIAPTANQSNRSQARDTSRVQCYNCQQFGHYARSCPNNEDGDPLTIMTTSGMSYYQPKWYEVGLDTMSQVNVLNSRFLENFVPGESSFRGLGNQTQATSYLGTLPLIPQLECQVCNDCAASILSFSKIKSAGVDITYDNSKEAIVAHTLKGDILFYQRGDLYLADFRDHLTQRALSGMTTAEREQLFDKSTVKRAQEAGQFIRSAGFPSEQTAINLVRSGNINNLPIEVQDIRNFFEIYGTPIPAIRGKTTQDHHVFKKDNYDSGLREQVTIQEQISDIMHVAGRKYLISMVTPLQVVLVVLR